MITSSELKEVLSYDPETGIFTWIKTHSKKRLDGKEAGSVQLTGYVGITIKRKKYLAHRLAWLFVHGRMPEDCIDHINGVRTDNRICNLREASRKENNQNLHNFRSNNSGYPGVVKFRDRWRVRLVVDYKEVHIGHYKSEEEAHEAYLAAKRKYHPLFAK